MVGVAGIANRTPVEDCKFGWVTVRHDYSCTVVPSSSYVRAVSMTFELTDQWVDGLKARLGCRWIYGWQLT